MGIKSKGQYMNRSILRTIKYMNGSLFSKARYMNGVGFEILARTPVPHLPPSYPPPPPPPRVVPLLQFFVVCAPVISYVAAFLSLYVFFSLLLPWEGCVS